MRTAPQIIAIALLAALLAPSSLSAVPHSRADSQVRIGTDLIVVEAVFGYIDDQTGEIVEANRIDTSKHKGFGWRVRLEGTRRTVQFREEFILPAPAQTWQVGRETKVAADRASAVTTGKRRLEGDMTLRNAWIHTPGDPRGAHTTRVYIDQVLVGEFDFTLF